MLVLDYPCSLTPLQQVTDNIVTTTVGNLYQSTMSVPVIAFGDAGYYFYEVTYGASDNFQGGSLDTESTQVIVYGEFEISDIIFGAKIDSIEVFFLP